ncbi:penicillin-binding transpeptidase domain-containing protein [Crossiella cryophila]|uniref:Beta-lactamase class D n=1 Tax=Crossiella cryophila TaxID=43355 RepID=A0A7W7FVQ4_9PSEU|nr:penicillin-binding transpeptidase domain-containing protein [Crossiella cryophila]MBB4680706.1 beta-lactamase class D [Crossiella cryophila]
MVSRRARNWLLTGGAVVTAAAAVAGVLAFWGPEAEQEKPGSSTPGRRPVLAAEAATGFLSAFGNNDIGSSAGLTDNRAAAEPVLKALRNPAQDTRPEMVTLRAKATPAPAPEQSELSVPFTARWLFGGGRVWEYEHTLPLRKENGSWAVRWAPEVLHPQFAAGRTLSMTTANADGELIGGDGKPVAGNDLSPQLLPTVRRALAGDLQGELSWALVLKEPDGKVTTTLAERKGKAANNAALTLLPQVQAAAQAAVNTQKSNPAMIVAIRSTGEILAIAQNPAADAKGLPALTGLYEPGSTFKVVTAAAVLQAGKADPGTVLPCPKEDVIKQRRVRNDDNFDLGEVPLSTAFAQSCNTTFARLAADLPTSTLPDAARQLGIGADFDVMGITTNTGSVPTPASPAAQVEASFGQGQVRTSPFGMALVSATVAAGGRRPVPILVRGQKTTVNGPGALLPANVANQLRTLMRGVVTNGTAKPLNGLGPVHGKTGTAQFGDGTQAHGWFTGFRNNIAFAVLIDNAGSSKPAVTMAAQFLKSHNA